MKPKQIAAYWPGKCKQCQSRYAKGDMVWYFGKGLGCKCNSCGNPSKPAPAPIDPAPYGAGWARSVTGETRVSFDSLSSLVDCALNGESACEGRIGEYNNGRCDGILSRLDGSDSWLSSYSRDRLLHDLDNPPAHFLSAIEEMKQELTDDIALPCRPRRKARHNLDDGDEMSVDRWSMRDPAAWSKMMREQAPRHVVTIGVNTSVLADVESHQLLYRGAAALALADVLQSRGMSVEVIAFKAVRNPSDGTSLGIIRATIKRADMPADIGALAMALSEIAVARAVFMVAGGRHWQGEIAGSFGQSCNLPADDRAGVDYLAEQTILSKDAAIAWLKECLK